MNCSLIVESWILMLSTTTLSYLIFPWITTWVNDCWELGLLLKEILQIPFKGWSGYIIFLFHFWRLQPLQRKRMSHCSILNRYPKISDLWLRWPININHQVTFVIFDMIWHALLLLMNDSTWILNGRDDNWAFVIYTTWRLIGNMNAGCPFARLANCLLLDDCWGSLWPGRRA